MEVVRDTEYWLIEQDVLVTFQCLPKITFPGYLLSDFCPNGWVEQLIALPFSLRAVHRLIRSPQQGLLGYPVGRIDSDPDARGNVRDPLLQFERLIDLTADVLGFRRSHFLTIDVLEYYRELIATESENRISTPYATLYPFPGFAEQIIACRVTQAVIHLLEAVQIKEHQRQFVSHMLCTFRPGQSMRKAIIEQLSIRKPREFIVRIKFCLPLAHGVFV
jgi:hypothetical protein